jgi:V/A-type H+-transporting ATPase subunit I
MAVSRMRRIQILAHRSVKDDVVGVLRGAGAVHVTVPSIEFEDDPGRDARRDRERELAGDLAKLEYVRTFLRPHAPKKKPLEKMFNPRLLLDEEELERIVAGVDVGSWYQRCLDIEGRIRSAEAAIARKEALAAELAHWAGLGGAPVSEGGAVGPLGIEEVTDTRHVRIGLLTLEASTVEALRREIGEVTSGWELVEVSRSGTTVYGCLFFLKNEEAEVAPILKRHGARWVDLADAEGEPDEASRRLLEEARALEADVAGVREEAVGAALEYDKVLVAVDEAAERLAKTSIEERFGATRETFLIEGWIRSRDEPAVRDRLTALSPTIYITARDPEAGEEIPIDLNNNPVVRPFEFVTTLYGRPVYWEFDPTPFLAPFFVVFFGLCISDAGYGLILAALTFVFMRKMQPGGGRKLMQLMFMGGLATAAVGAITGGWFGIDPGIMPAWLRGMIVMNPLREPMKMLNVVFILGIVQILTGLAIKMVAELREGRWLDAILDQFVWIVFIVFLVPLGYNFILGGEISAGVMDLCKKAALGAGLVVVATGARKNPNPIMKVLGGVLKLYDIVGYFGDVLSYARLLALGLATGAIAMAINGVAEMASGIPFVGIVAAVIVLIGGHLFNIAVNCLGGFVHSGRLQYLEFFSKFFEGGGRAFTPFREEKKYSVVRR